jgi:hypothetical protein
MPAVNDHHSRLTRVWNVTGAGQFVLAPLHHREALIKGEPAVLVREPTVEWLLAVASAIAEVQLVE